LAKGLWLAHKPLLPKTFFVKEHVVIVIGSGNSLYEVLRQMPKVDLHRHLEGSLRLSTLTQLAQEYQIILPAYHTEELRPFVQIINDPPGYRNFLDKFLILRRFYKSPEAIFRLTEEAIADAAADNVCYLELRFSPQALATPNGFALDSVTDWVIAATHKAAAVHDIQVGLIVTLLRHEELATAARVAHIALDRRDKGIVALDLAGDEYHFPPEPFAGIFRDARQEGLGITIHAGEWVGPASVRGAVEALGAERLGHGVRVIEDPSTLALVRERNITLEVCLTSNIQTGVVSDIEHHPLPRLMAAGLRTTINTDDPSVSDIELTKEYEIAIEKLGLDYATLCQQIIRGAEAAFLPPPQKAALVSSLTHSLNQFSL